MKTLQILCVIDMQNDFITGTLANSAAEAILPKVAEFIENFDGEVIFTRDTHIKDYLETNEGYYLPVEHCIEGTEGRNIHESLLCREDIKIIDKPTFGSIDLMDYLQDVMYLNSDDYDNLMPREGENTEIHIVGTVSSICVVSNALLTKANFPKAKVIVHKNMCADLDDVGQEAAMLVMQRCQCEIVED